MKFTALTVASTTTTVTATRTGVGRTVLVPKNGTESSWTPLKAITPAARIWPASLVSQSSSRMSSMAPTRQTIAAPMRTPEIWPLL